MTWDAKRIIRYILLFCLFIGVVALISIISGEPIDWGSALFLAVVLTIGWIFADIMGYRRLEREKEARRKEIKEMSKAEKRAFKEAAQARERREKEAAAAEEKQGKSSAKTDNEPDKANGNATKANGSSAKTGKKKGKKN